MLTAYDQYAAEIFDEAGIPVLLVGDSAGNNVLGYETTVPVTVDEMLPLVRAVSRSAAARAGGRPTCRSAPTRPAPSRRWRPATRFMKEGGAHAVKLEGGARGGAAGRGAGRRRHPGDGAHRLHPAERARARRLPGAGPRRRRPTGWSTTRCALQEAGAFAVVLEMVPATWPSGSPRCCTIPTIGIGAGPHCDAQVLVWQDMAGLRGGKMAAVRQAVRRPARHAARRPRRPTPPTWGPGRSRPRSRASTEPPRVRVGGRT